MYIIEDFRHAPMRPLAIAETPEEAHAVAAALGITGHAFLRPVQTITACDLADHAVEQEQSVLSFMSAGVA